MREIIATLEAKIQMKINELSRMEKEIAIARSVITNDIRQLQKVLNIHCPKLLEEPKNDLS
jgi:hypothetical protein